MNCKDFNYIVFFEDNRTPHKYTHVNNPYNLYKNMSVQGVVTCINVYHKKTRDFFIQLKNLNMTFNFFQQYKIKS